MTFISTAPAQNKYQRNDNINLIAEKDNYFGCEFQ